MKINISGIKVNFELGDLCVEASRDELEVAMGNHHNPKFELPIEGIADAVALGMGRAMAREKKEMEREIRK